MPTTANIVELRRLLAERHPQAQPRRRARLDHPTVSTGLPALDTLLQGGWPKGRLSELVGTGSGSGTTLVIHAWLQQLAVDRQFLALIDGLDSFDVDAVEPDVLARLLWVRCQRTDDALKATDILLRDRNFSFVVLDLKLNPIAQLRKVPSSVWHRFRRLQEQNGTTLLVVTPTQLVGGAHCRVHAESNLSLTALTRPPSELLSSLRFEVRRSTEDGEAFEAATSTDP